MISLIALLLAGSPESMTTVTLQGLSFKAPAAWSKSADDENSLTFASPDDQGKLAVSVYPLEKPIPPPGCLKKMVEAVGEKGFENLTIATAPAAKKSTSDFVGEGEAAKTDENKVTTITVLGCNGKTKWLLTWTAKTSQAARFGPLYKRIIDSVSYGKAAP